MSTDKAAIKSGLTSIRHITHENLEKLAKQRSGANGTSPPAELSNMDGSVVIGRRVKPHGGREYFVRLLDSTPALDARTRELTFNSRPINIGHLAISGQFGASRFETHWVNQPGHSAQSQVRHNVEDIAARVREAFPLADTS